MDCTYSLLCLVARYIGGVCESNPCVNGGTCIVDFDDPSKFSCFCAEGFNGLSCQGNYTFQKTDLKICCNLDKKFNVLKYCCAALHARY